MQERDQLQCELEREKEERDSQEEQKQFERLSRDLLDNFQEKMEIKQSLLELEELNKYNTSVIMKMRENSERMQRDIVRKFFLSLLIDYCIFVLTVN